MKNLMKLAAGFMVLVALMVVFGGLLGTVPTVARAQYAIRNILAGTGVTVSQDLNDLTIGLSPVLPGRILVGNATSNAAAVAVSGDITLANNGAVAIAAGAIVDADVNAAAAIAATKISGTAVTYATMAQVDEAETTDPTDYTPAFKGQALIGQAGAGTNALWVAKGVTTNDWVGITLE